MPGFTGDDDITYGMTTLGQQKLIQFNKNFLPTTAAVAGEWFSLFRGGGNPTADSVMNTGTNLLFQQMKDTTTNATGILHGGDVSPAYKFLMAGNAWSSAATVAPSTAQLIDILGWYRVTSVTTTSAQSTTNTLIAFSTFTADAGTDVLTHSNINLMHLSRVQFSTTTTLPGGLSAATNYFVIKLTDTTFKVASSYANAVAGTNIDITSAGTGTHTINTLLPRYTNGANVEAFFVNTNATPLGAATPNLSLGYTNSQGVSSRATPATPALPIGKTAAANGLILHSGATGVGKYGPAVPLQAGDAGILQIDTIQNSTSYVSGEYAVVLFTRLMTFPITTLGVAAERETKSQVPSFPRIYDGACLTLLINAGANIPTNSQINGQLSVAWR